MKKALVLGLCLSCGAGVAQAEAADFVKTYAPFAGAALAAGAVVGVYKHYMHTPNHQLTLAKKSLHNDGAVKLNEQFYSFLKTQDLKNAEAVYSELLKQPFMQQVDHTVLVSELEAFAKELALREADIRGMMSRSMLWTKAKNAEFAKTLDELADYKLCVEALVAYLNNAAVAKIVTVQANQQGAPVVRRKKFICRSCGH